MGWAGGIGAGGGQRIRTPEPLLRLEYRPPYDWDQVLAFLAPRATPGVETVEAGGYRRSFRDGRRHGVLEVRHAPRARALEVRVRTPDPRRVTDVAQRLRALFDLDADPAAISRRFRSDARLGPLVRRSPGLRVPGAWDAFELCVRAILGQQVTVAAASTQAGRLARRFGERLRIEDPALTHAFPTPRALAIAPIDGMPRARAAAIRDLAQAVAAGRLRLTRSDGDVLAGLRRIKGVGEWTAQYVAMRALRDPDAFPAGDLVLQRVAGRGRRLSASALLTRAEAWRPFRAYAALHLWRAA